VIKVFVRRIQRVIDLKRAARLGEIAGDRHAIDEQGSGSGGAFPWLIAKKASPEGSELMATTPVPTLVPVIPTTPSGPKPKDVLCEPWLIPRTPADTEEIPTIPLLPLLTPSIPKDELLSPKIPRLDTLDPCTPKEPLSFVC
jgi:hypothetical protein